MARIDDALSRKSSDCLDDIIKIVRESGALDYTQSAAREQTQLAITCLDRLPDSDYRDAMGNSDPLLCGSLELVFQQPQY